jgi:hypothetical protein
MSLIRNRSRFDCRLGDERTDSGPDQHQPDQLEHRLVVFDNENRGSIVRPAGHAAMLAQRSASRLTRLG